MVLRRTGGHLQIVCNGVFLISAENESSSRALIRAARSHLPERPVDVLIGGLGLGNALDEALDLPRLRSLTVVELEPAVLDWFHGYGGSLAERAAADARVRMLLGDVRDALAGASDRWDLIALDTDNGPDWLVRPANAHIYGAAGLLRVRRALRVDGVAVYWTAGHSAAFEAALTSVFGGVRAVEAVDIVGGRPHTSVMYVVHGEWRRRRPRP
jgi:spermidine synthase